MNEEELLKEDAKIRKMLEDIVRDIKVKTDLHEIVMDIGGAIARIIEREVEADHLGHALGCLAPMIMLEHLRAVLEGKPRDDIMQTYIDSGVSFNRGVIEAEAENMVPMNMSELPNDMPDILKQILSGNIPDDMEVKVAQFRRRRKGPPEPTTLN